MMATTAMAETATAMARAKATEMMLPPPPIQMMSMTTTAAIQGWRLDDGNWTTTMGQQRYASMMTAMTAMAAMAKDGDGDGNCDRDGNADDAAAVDGKDVNEDNGSNSRMAIGRQ
jgi:hypothetical protein